MFLCSCSACKHKTCTMPETENITLYSLPDEILESIFTYLPPVTLAAASATSKRLNKIANEPLLWRYHCQHTWKYWKDVDKLRAQLAGPAGETQWKEKFLDRKTRDRYIKTRLDALLDTQKGRIARMEALAGLEYDAKDVLLEEMETPQDAEDVLARRYYSEAILGLIHRRQATREWHGLEHDPFPPLERALGAFDLFVLGSRQGDVSDTEAALDRIAANIRREHRDVDRQHYQQRAVTVASYLRAHGLVGNDDETRDYHALPNNYMGVALTSDTPSTLPLQSAAIYTCVARRLGLNAWPCNYPFHIYVLVDSSDPSTPSIFQEWAASRTVPRDAIYMDPWRQETPADREELESKLRHMSIPRANYYQYMLPALSRDMIQRTGRNIVTSVENARERRGGRRNLRTPDLDLDVDSAFYSFLWSSMFALGANGVGEVALRNYLPYLAEHFQNHYPEDIGLIERYIVPLMTSTGHPHLDQLILLLEAMRAEDRSDKPQQKRDGPRTQNVKFKVGQPFQHMRYGYQGVVVGWDPKCQAQEDWMMNMRVDQLPRGRNQSFYHVL